MFVLVALSFAITSHARQIVSVRDRVGLQQVVAASGGTLRCVSERACFVEGVDPQTLRPFAREVVADSLLSAPLLYRPYDVRTLDCGALWELDELGVQDVWPIARGEHAPVIAVLDSGFRTAHPDLKGRIDGEWDYGENDASANVSWASALPHHGTFILGLLAARSDNDRGRAGIAPSARVFAQKIADDNGALYFSYAIEALAAIADGTVPASIVSYSLSSKSPPQAFTEAIADLNKAGVIVVAAASNCNDAYCHDANNDDYPLYPTSDPGPHVLSVASSKPGGKFNPYSHFGPDSVDLAAPGVDLCSLSASVNNSTFVASGTSYAAPLVAGAAALVWEAHPNLTHLEVARLIKASAHPEHEWQGRVLSGGVLDLKAALHTAMPRISAPTETSITLENVAAEGELQVIFFHDNGVALERPNGVTARPFSKNEVLALPGLSRAPGPGTLWTLSVKTHASVTLNVKRKDPNARSKTVSVRVMSRAQALALGSPRAPGVTSDPTGAPALLLQLPEAALPPEPEEKPQTPPPLEPSEVAQPMAPAPSQPAATHGAVGIEARGCQSTESAFGWIAAAMFVLRSLRRHERHRSKARRASS